jgi:hypothetical protein
MGNDWVHRAEIDAALLLPKRGICPNCPRTTATAILVLKCTDYLYLELVRLVPTLLSEALCNNCVLQVDVKLQPMAFL